MPKAVDLTGQTFGRLTVLNKSEEKRRGRSLWQCQCECGTPVLALPGDLKSEAVRSCGCLRTEVRAEHARKLKARHGGQKEQPREYDAWHGLQTRNLRPPEWDDFVQFFVDVGERPSDNHVLSRRDVRQPHSKENTYWKDANAEREAYNQLTSQDLTDEFCFDFRAHLRAATAA